jgi:hypothetical protein
LLRPHEERIEGLVASRHAAAVPQAGDAKRVSLTSAGQLGRFYAHFDRPETIDVWLAKLYNATRASGLAFAAADYQLSDGRYGLERYRITLPVSGSYFQVRTFLDLVLTEIPVLSLDSIAFRRKSISEAGVEAELSFTLYLSRR